MIKIIADMASDISKSDAERLGIEVIPFMIMADGKQIIADINLSHQEYYSIINSCKEIPSTGQVSPADIEDIYRRAGKENTIIQITMSAVSSGLYNTSSIVAEQLRDEGFDITIVDSGMFAMVVGSGVIAAGEMAQAGATKEEIVAMLEEKFSRDTAYFAVDDLTYLKKGGRIKATTMAISKALDIKPILFINDGMVEALSKVRGLKKALSALVDYAEERMENPQENELMILDSDASDKVEIVEQMIRERINPKSIVRCSIGPIITTHAGTGLVGIYFKHKKPYTDYNK